MMRVRLAVPDSAVHPDVLNAALEAVTRTNEHLLHGDASMPLADEAIAKGVKWRPEPPGDEHFDIAPTVLRRGHGDCDDLAPYKAASLRVTGEDPEARAVVLRSGPKRWHAVVERSDGSIDDPSADAGMYEYRSPLQPRMVGPRRKPNLATKRIVGAAGRGGVWCARCDVPWRHTSMAISGHGMGRTQVDAASDAIESACVVGDASGAADPEDLARLAALQSLARGMHPEDVYASLQGMGVPNVGSFFGKLLKTAAHLAPIPGVSKAYDLASSAASMLHKKKGTTVGPVQHGGGGGGGHGGGGGGGFVHPAGGGGGGTYGPLIIRF